MKNVTTFALVLLTGGSLISQETAPATQPDPKPIDAAALLDKAIAKMARLNSVCFKTTELQDAASTRQIMKQMAGLGAGVLGSQDKIVRGASSDGILHARMNHGDDEVVLHRGRMVARSDSEWKLRRNRLFDGSPMPFVLDPQLFFEVLGRLPKSSLAIRKVDHRETTKGKRVVLSITLKGDAANDFGLAGTLPAVEKGLGGMVTRLGAMAGGGDSDLIIDLALTVDPDTALVHRVRSASYQEGGLPGGGRVVLGGGGGFGEDEEEDEEEEVKTHDAQGNRLYRRGLPVRKLEDSLSRMEFDISFTRHGQPYVFELDAAGRKLLRLPAGTTGK